MVGFEVVTVAGDTYPDAAGGPLAASTEALKLTDVLAAGGDVMSDPVHVVVETKADLEDLLERWSQPNAPRSSIVYVVGHGEWDGSRHTFLLPEVAKERHSRLRTSNLADYLRAEWLRRKKDSQAWALFILDCCQSSKGIGNINADLEDDLDSRPERLGMWPVNVDGAANLGRFVAAFADQIDQGFTENDEAIPLNEIYRRVKETLGDLQERSNLPWHAVLSNPKRAPVPLLLTKDAHEELQRLIADQPAEFRSHFLTKAQGAESGELAWYFVGRDQEIADIFAWLDSGQPGMKVVTGDAGSGKSALLGHVAVLADQELVGAYSAIAPHLADAPTSDGVVDATIHLTGKTLVDVLAFLHGETSGAADLSDEWSAQPVDSVAPGTTWTPFESVAAPSLDSRSLLSMLDSQWPTYITTQPFTLLVDALDEAQEPESIAAFLAELGNGEHNARVLIGSRRSLEEGPDTPPDPSQRGLLDMLQVADDDLLVLERDPKAAEEYVFRRLQAAGYSTVDAKTLARRIGQADEHFLFARLVTSELIAAHGTSMPSPDELDDLLTGGHRGVFASAIDRLRRDDRPVAVAVEALSRARGRGLPRDRGVWQLIANVVGEAHGIEITEADLDRALKKAAAYITLDAEAGVSTYRLAHQTFVEFFLYESGNRTLHHEITGALFGRNVADNGWAQANYYETRYLIEHATLAIEAGVGQTIDDLVLDSSWLNRASELIPIDTLVSLLDTTLDRGGEYAVSTFLPSLLVRILRNSRVTLGARPYLLGPMLEARGFVGGADVAALAGRPWLQLTSDRMGMGPVWGATYSTAGKARALAFGTPDDERLLAMGIDERIEMWDPRTSGPDLGRSIHLDGRATALAFGEVGGTPALAIVRSYDGVLEVRRLDGSAACDPIELSGMYTTQIALGEIADQEVAALGAVDVGEVTLVRLDDGTTMPLHAELEGSRFVGVSVIDNGLVGIRIVTYDKPRRGADGSLQIVRLESGDIVAETPTTGLMLQALETTCAARYDDELVHAAIVADHVRIWEPDGELLDWWSPLSDEQRTGIRALAIVPFPSHIAVASAPDIDRTAMVHLNDVAEIDGDDPRLQLGMCVGGVRTVDGGGFGHWTAEHESMPRRSFPASISPDDLVEWPRSSYQEFRTADRHLAVTGSIGSAAVIWDLTSTPATPVAGPFDRSKTWKRYSAIPVKGGPEHTRDAALAELGGHGLCVAIASGGLVRLEKVDGGELAIPLVDQFVDVAAVALGKVRDLDVIAVGSQNGRLWVVGLDSDISTEPNAALLGEFSFDEPIYRIRLPEDGAIEVETSSNQLHRFEVRFPPGTEPVSS